VLGTVHEYASGPAIIRVEGRAELTARAAGTVSSVNVQPGQRVTADQVLVTFYTGGEVSALERVEQEFELQLIRVLDKPSDETARQALTTLRAERELARAKLEERLVKSPQAGVVSDIRIRPGQHLEAGEIVLAIVPDDATFMAVAMLPGQYRPLLRPGMPLRLELTGYHHTYRDLVVESIGDEVVGPGEIKRYLGQEVGDTVAIAGPVVLVRARVPTRTFVSDGRQFNYFDGMQGQAEVRVRAESILVTLVPGLKAFL
jgi:membrane fusion protein (multidrug efflux system)